MPTTKTNPRAKTARKTRATPSRPVTEILLELAYKLHATRVVSRPEAANTRQPISS